MECFEYMSAADGRKRELANFEIDMKSEAKPKKKGSAASPARTAGGSSARKAAGPAKKAASAAAAKGTAAKKAASGAKASAKSGAKASAGSKAATGAKAASAAAKKKTDGQKKAAPKKQARVEENPLARRDSSVRAAGRGASVAWANAPCDGFEFEPPKRTKKPSQAAGNHESRNEFEFDSPKRAKKPAQAAVGNRKPRDEFAFDASESPKRPRQNKKKKKRKKRRSPFSALTLLLLVLIGGITGLGAWRINEYETFKEMKAVVSRQTFYDGTTVEGIDVSAMTLSDALNHWDTQIEPAFRETSAVLNDGTRVTAAQLGYSSDYVQTLSSAWNAGRTGSLVERYRRVTAHMAEPRSYDVARSFYDEELVRAYVVELASQIDTEARDAHLESFDVDTQSFTYAREQVGRTLDQEKLAQDLRLALDAGGGNVQLEIEAVAPRLTAENVSSQYGMITSAVTNASSSSRNRLNNIALSLQLINGSCLEPGETFSFNEVVGQRTKDRGFKSAPAYSRGEVTEEVGGGVCQVSTTLFNAAVKSNMEIEERHNHSMTVSYVDPGKDAAVDWGNKDLKFTNTSDDNVYICCYLSEDKRVHIAVYGKLLEDGKTITVEGKKTDTIDPETEYRVNFSMASGQTKLVQEGKKGYSATTYKIWWDAAGNEIEREQICKSRYNAANEIVEYGP